MHGQPYDGPIDAQSVADFALSTLRNSPYGKSNTAWGLAELDWQDVDDASGDELPFYIAIDEDADCRDMYGDCTEDTCNCPSSEYFVSVARNTQGE